MKTIYKWTVSVPIVLQVMIVSLVCLAQESAGGGADDEYESSLQPGMHIKVDSQTSGSVLSQAARERKSIVINGQTRTAGPSRQPGKVTYIVKEGDTLFAICGSLWGDPYLWPRLWALNTKITNPHWIYPGDVLRLTAQTGGGGEETRDVAMPTAALNPQTGGGGVMLRNRGFVDTEILKQSGELVGANKNVSMLGQFDEAYVEFGEDANVTPGARYVAFEILGPVQGIDDPDSEIGKLVEILGDVKVLSYDSKSKIARVYIEESIAPIVRGTLIGPVHRRFDYTPAVVNQETLKGKIIAMLDPLNMAAQHHLVFVDIGTEQGVRDGNRIFAIEARDNYRKSRDEEDDREGYPTEVIAELRVIEARPNTSTCLVTASVREIYKGQDVEMRAGY